MSEVWTGGDCLSGGEAMKDWTVDPVTHRANSSPAFLELSSRVEEIIRNDAHRLIAGRAGDTATLIIAQLAHVYRMRPGAKKRKARLKP